MTSSRTHTGGCWSNGAGTPSRPARPRSRLGVLLLPGSVYDEPDHVRIGFGRANMPDALGLLEANLAEAG